MTCLACQHPLEALVRANSTLGLILGNAQNKLRHQAMPRRAIVALIAWDKAIQDLFWLRNESLSESENLPAPEVIAHEIMEHLETVLH